MTYDPHGKVIEQTLVDLASPTPHKDITVHHGGAGGADLMAGEACNRQGINTKVWPADWPKHGPRAGVIRNHQMLQFGPPFNSIVAFWDRYSKGTLHMIASSIDQGNTVLIVYPWNTEYGDEYFEKEVITNTFELMVIANRHKMHEPESRIVVSTNDSENPWNLEDIDAEIEES